MSVDGLAPDEVLALHFDEPAAAGDIAAWCGGHVEQGERADGVVVPIVVVPTAKGPRPALLGDWVVRVGEDDHVVRDGTAFAAGHDPA